MTEISEQELRDLAEEAERTKDDPYPADAPPPSRPGLARSKVLQVRLNPEEYDALQAYADKKQLPISPIVRGWILEQLRTQPARQSLQATVEHLAEEVEHLRRLVDEQRKAAS